MRRGVASHDIVSGIARRRQPQRNGKAARSRYLAGSRRLPAGYRGRVPRCPIAPQMPLAVAVAAR